MNTKVVKQEVEVAVDHPMEGILEIAPGTTLLPQLQQTTEMTVAETYDDKDNEIENQFQEVYDKAMGAYDSQTEQAELVEGKYKARVGEVSVQFLNTALEAARSKAQQKQSKDKLVVDSKKAGPKTLNQNLFVGDRNELLKHFMDRNKNATT